jgi:hypothetical protein
MCGLTTAPSTACHPEPREGSGRALALAFAFAFLVVIPGGNLLLPLPLPLLVILSRAKDLLLPSPQNSPTAGHLEGAKRVERPAFAFAFAVACHPEPREGSGLALSPKLPNSRSS